MFSSLDEDNWEDDISELESNPREIGVCFGFFTIYRFLCFIIFLICLVIFGILCFEFESVFLLIILYFDFLFSDLNSIFIKV